MIYEDIQVSGSISISGSFTIPVHATTTAANQSTGSLFFDSTAKLFKVFQSGAGAVITSDQPYTPPAPAAREDIEYLVIGGGGSGGQLGGGGAGGHLSGSFAQVTSGSSLTVTVGGGGASITSVVRGNTGTDSSIAVTGYTTATALGGGGGGGQGSASDAGTGKDGGSGGGGGENDAGTNTPGSGTTGQGNDGGTGGTGAGTQLSGGGGGGAGAAGSDAAGQSAGGAGGNGLANKITGTSTTRAGGGGGGAWWYNNGGSSTGGAGGSGGGGAAGTTGNTAAVSGTSNTGGGGGGAGFTSAGWWISNSGTGGSGVAVLAYPTGSLKSKGGNRKYFDDRVAHIFNSSGTLAVGTGTHTHDTKDVFGDGSCLALYQFEDNVEEFSGTGRLTGNAAIFNGSSSILTMNQATVLGNIFGVTFWINIPSTPPDNDWIFQFSYGQNVGMYIDSSGVLQVYIGSYMANESYATSQTISTNTWYHVVLTCDGSTTTTYVNGVSKGTGGLSGGQNTTYNYNNVIGGYHTTGNASNHISMKMEDFRIYNRHITSTEASYLYNDTDISSTSLANRYIMKTDFNDSVGSRNLTNSNVTFRDKDGTAYNMTYTQGYINQSAVFNGSNGYVASGFTAPTATESSISFWVNIAAYTNYGGFVGDSTGTGNHVRFFLGQGSGTSGNLWVSVANGSSNWYDDTTVSLSSYGLDTWFHICGTVTGTAVKIYINGSLVQSFTSTVSYVGGGQYPYYFGGWGSSLYLNGQLDQVRFFNKALSASEVATLYNE